MPGAGVCWAAEGLVAGPRRRYNVDRCETLEANAHAAFYTDRAYGSSWAEVRGVLSTVGGGGGDPQEPTREQLARFAPEAKEEGVRIGIGSSSSGSGCADHEDEGRADALGSYKAEHAVDLSSASRVMAVTLQPADAGDPLCDALARRREVRRSTGPLEGVGSGTHLKELGGRQGPLLRQ